MAPVHYNTRDVDDFHGAVCFRNFNGTGFDLEVATGEQRRRFEPDGPGLHVMSCPPTVVDGVVYVGNKDGSLYALDAESGAKRWSFKTGDEVYASPAVVGGIVFVASADGNLYALSSG